MKNKLVKQVEDHSDIKDVKVPDIENKDVTKIEEPTVPEGHSENVVMEDQNDSKDEVIEKPYNPMEMFSQNNKISSQSFEVSTKTEIKRILPKWILHPSYIETDEDGKKSER